MDSLSAHFGWKRVGWGLAAPPSHTTGRTVPYPAVHGEHLRLRCKSPLTRMIVACRARLTLGLPTFGGAAAYSQGPLRLLSPRACIFLAHRTLRAGSAPHVRPFAAM